MQTANNILETPWVTASLALVQAVVLYFLYITVEESRDFAQNPEYLNAIAGFAIAFPLILLFVRRKAKPSHTLYIAAGVALVIALCGFYAGLQSKPIDKLSTWSISAVFILASLIIAFKAVIYGQLFVAKKAYTFGHLYQHSWRTFIVGAQAWIFTWILFGILYLGASLFNIIGIILFDELLDEPYITIPIFTLSFSFAINYFQSSEKVADTIAMVLQSLIKFALPFVSLIIIGFVLSMIFTGIGTLWEDGPGSVLILWLQALALFFVNTVYMGTQKDTPYKPWLHNLILVSIAFLPIYSLLASYGLWLRIDQYGLTPSRGFGMLVNLLISAFSFSYFVAIVKARSNWFLIKNKINVVLGIAVVIVCILLNTPLLSMQVWSTYSQMARLDVSKPMSDEDMRFFKNNLGAPGYNALMDIRDKMLVLDISYDKRLQGIFINYSYSRNFGKNEETIEYEQSYKTLPANLTIPPEIVEATFTERYEGQDVVFIQVDLNGDNNNDYIALIDLPYGASEFIWTFENDKWKKSNATLIKTRDSVDIEKFFIDPSTLSIEVQEPQFKQLKIGDAVLYIPPKKNEN